MLKATCMFFRTREKTDDYSEDGKQLKIPFLLFLGEINFFYEKETTVIFSLPLKFSEPPPSRTTLERGLSDPGRP